MISKIFLHTFRILVRNPLNPFMMMDLRHNIAIICFLKVDLFILPQKANAYYSNLIMERAKERFLFLLRYLFSNVVRNILHWVSDSTKGGRSIVGLWGPLWCPKSTFFLSWGFNLSFLLRRIV
jgi:hypothetical protein